MKILSRQPFVLVTVYENAVVRKVSWFRMLVGTTISVTQCVILFLKTCFGFYCFVGPETLFSYQTLE